MRAKDNPLRVERVHALQFRPVGWTWETLLAQIEVDRVRGAIVGPEGSGKTTLLERIERHFVVAGKEVIRLTLRADAQELSRGWRDGMRALNNQMLLLDGAEQLSAAAWKHFLGETDSCPGLIVTSHRPGLLPTLVECSTNVALLDSLLNDLLPAETIASLGELASDLHARRCGNVRLVLRDLYDHFSHG